MSLRLRILLLITAVNVAVLVLVVYVGLKVVEDIDPVGTSAFVEGLQVAMAERPLDRPWNRVRLMVRIRSPGDLPEPYAPPGQASEAEEAQALLLDAIQRGNTGITRAPGRLIVVHPEGTRPVRAFYVAFHSRANEESLDTLRSIYILLCAGTVLLTLGIFFVLSRLVLRPLEELAAASRAVAQGLPPVPVRATKGKDEMSHLVDNFNRMSSEVYEYQQHLEDRVLHSIRRVGAAESRLVVAQRLASTGTLAAGFAHEINNPLGGTINALRRLRGDDLSPERREEYFELVLDGLDRIRTIVDRILNFTPSTREPAPIDVGDVCRRAVALAAHRAEKRRVELKQEAEGAMRGAVGDQELTQAILNLILNAVDAMPQDRTPAEGGPEGQFHGTVTVRARIEPAAAVIEVEDDGEGMDEETRRRCVDFFFSTKPEGEGSGLGLAIVQHIVTDHGGTLDIASAKGEGTLVRVRLPLGQDARDSRG